MTVVIAVTRQEECDRPDVSDALRNARSVARVLAESGLRADLFEINPALWADPAALMQRLREREADCVFNLFDGFSHEPGVEARFARLLEADNIPFTGNGSAPLELCLDKGRTRDLLAAGGVDVPPGLVVRTWERAAGLAFPLFVKPRCEDASVGIDEASLVRNAEELRRVLPEKLRHFPAGLVVEEFIGGAEYNVGMLRCDPPEFLGVSVIDYGKYSGCRPFLGYEAKWDEASTDFRLVQPDPAGVTDPDLKRRIVQAAMRAGRLLGCGGYYRVDLRERDGRLYVLDVNPNPDINEDSGFARQAYQAGMTYSQMIRALLPPGICQPVHREGGGGE